MAINCCASLLLILWICIFQIIWFHEKQMTSLVLTVMWEYREEFFCSVLEAFSIYFLFYFKLIWKRKRYLDEAVKWEHREYCTDTSLFCFQCSCSQWRCAWWTLLCLYQADSLWSVVCNLHPNYLSHLPNWKVFRWYTDFCDLHNHAMNVEVQWPFLLIPI